MNTYSLSRVYDKAKRPVRGLWLRNGSFVVQTTVTDAATGIKRVARLTLKASTLEDAKAEAARIKDAAIKGQITLGGSGPTFAEYRQQYFDKNVKAPSTRKNEDHFLGQWQKFLGDDYRIGKISAQNVLAYRSELIAKQLKPNSVNLHLRALKQLLILAKTEGHIDKLPFDGIKQIKVKNAERNLLTKEELEAMRNEAIANHPRSGEMFADYLSLLMYSGARCSETLQLTWKHIDFDNEQICFTGNISKGDSRRIDFNPSLKNLLLEMKAKRKDDQQYLFGSERTDKPVVSFKKIMREIRAKLGLHEFTFHLTRHYFISQCVMAGIDFLTIARWVGHKDGGVLIGKTYGHLNNTHLKAMAAKLV